MTVSVELQAASHRDDDAPAPRCRAPWSPATSFSRCGSDVEAAMELDLLGVAVRAASKDRSSTIKLFQPWEVTSWGDGASCWVIVWGCRRAMLPRRVGHAWSRLEPAR
jgi:hypothetical protein